MSDTPATPGTTKAAGTKKVGDLEALLSEKTAEIDTLKGQVRTLSSQKEKADSLAKRNGLIAIIAAIATGLLAFLFIAANSATGQAAGRIGDLQGQLEACNKKPPPAPVLPAAPVPATGNDSCVTQETHVTVNGLPASPPSVKIEKKQKTGQPGKAPVTPGASTPSAGSTPTAGAIPDGGCRYIAGANFIRKGGTTAEKPGTVLYEITNKDLLHAKDAFTVALRKQYPNWLSKNEDRIPFCLAINTRWADENQSADGRQIK